MCGTRPANLNLLLNNVLNYNKNVKPLLVSGRLIEKMNDLFATEKLLERVFAELSLQRDGGPVFMIENGLLCDDVDQLLHLVAQRAEIYQFTKRAWAEFPLSICVAVTEIGYEYRGTGTEFWPMVELGLKVDIPVSQRNVISELFRNCAKQHGTAKPMQDAWSKAFPHISWPVRNAMVPREIHAPLARLVREFLVYSRSITIPRASIQGLRDLAKGFGSRRLESWLQNDDLAYSVISYLVSGRTTDMSVETAFLKRLGNDLRSESEVRSLERAIRARRLAQHQGLDYLPKAKYELLLDDAEARGLALRGPSLSLSELEAVRVELDVPLSNLTITVGARSTTLQRFFDGDAVFIGRPVGEAPRPYLSEFEMPDWLAAVVTPSSGLLFRDEGDDGYQPQIRPSDRVTSGTGFYEMASEALSPETWGDGLYHFVSGTPEGDAALARYGMHVETDPMIEFLGGLTLFLEGNTIGQVTGHQVRASPKVSINLLAERLDKPGSFEIRLPDSRWTPLPMTEGFWTLSPVGSGKIIPMNLVFRETEPQEAVALTLQPDGLGVSEIARGTAALHLSTPITLHDVKVEVTLESSNGQFRSICIDVSSTPAKIPFDLPEFTDIRASARLWRGGGLRCKLRTQALGLDERSWALSSPEPEWKLDRQSGQWTSETMEPLNSLVCDPEASCAAFLPQDPSAAQTPTDYRLMRPDGPSDGTLRSCILIEPKKGTSLSMLPRVSTAPILRLSKAPNDNSGLLNALEAYFSWSLATVGTTIGEGLRAGACSQLEDGLVAALCGNRWATAERRSLALGAGFHARLVTEAVNVGLVCDTTAFSPLNEDEKHTLVDLLESEFRRILPAPDLIVIPDEPMWPEMDDAVLDAWTQLSAEATENGRAELEFDAGSADGEWQSAVFHAREAARLPALVALILPSQRALNLERLPYESCHFDDLIAALTACHADVQSRGGRWITPADLRALFLLFLAPERVMDDPEWKDRILRFGADRFTARAVRYTALRYRAQTTARNA